MDVFFEPEPNTFPDVPLGANGIQLVDEDDRRRLLLGQREGVSHQLGAVSDEHLDQLRPGKLQEGGLGLGGARARHQGLAGAGRAVQQHALRK